MTLGFSSGEEGLVLQVAFHAESHHGIRLAKHGPSPNSSEETWKSKRSKLNKGRMKTLATYNTSERFPMQSCFAA